jgi:hypothetical protein
MCRGILRRDKCVIKQDTKTSEEDQVEPKRGAAMNTIDKTSEEDKVEPKRGRGAIRIIDLSASSDLEEDEDSSSEEPTVNDSCRATLHFKTRSYTEGTVVITPQRHCGRAQDTPGLGAGEGLPLPSPLPSFIPLQNSQLPPQQVSWTPLIEGYLQQELLNQQQQQRLLPAGAK